MSRKARWTSAWSTDFRACRTRRTRHALHDWTIDSRPARNYGILRLHALSTLTHIGSRTPEGAETNLQPRPHPGNRRWTQHERRDVKPWWRLRPRQLTSRLGEWSPAVDGGARRADSQRTHPRPNRDRPGPDRRLDPEAHADLVSMRPLTRTATSPVPDVRLTSTTNRIHNFPACELCGNDVKPTP